MTTAQEIRRNFWDARDNGLTIFKVKGITMSVLASKGNDMFLASVTKDGKTYHFNVSRNASKENNELRVSEQMAKLIKYK